MEQSLLEVGGNAVLRPVSFLERAASCLPSTGRSGLPTSTRGVTESGDSSSIDAAWRGRKGDNLEGFGQTGLIAGFPGRRFAGRVVEMQGGILTAGGRSHEFLHRTLRQRDEPLYRKLRAPEDAFFGVGDRAHAGTGEGGAEDGDDLRRESATTAVPSTFHQVRVIQAHLLMTAALARAQPQTDELTKKDVFFLPKRCSSNAGPMAACFGSVTGFGSKSKKKVTLLRSSIELLLLFLEALRSLLMDAAASLAWHTASDFLFCMA